MTSFSLPESRKSLRIVLGKYMKINKNANGTRIALCMFASDHSGYRAPPGKLEKLQAPGKRHRHSGGQTAGQACTRCGGNDRPPSFTGEASDRYRAAKRHSDAGGALCFRGVVSPPPSGTLELFPAPFTTNGTCQRAHFAVVSSLPVMRLTRAFPNGVAQARR
jgi:hypothetical protein